MFVTYLAHDLDDPSIWRRVEMLRRGGAQVRVAGFRRGDGALPETVITLGRTSNGRMVQRVRAIAAAWPRIARRIPAPQGANTEVILARNLEMLALGARLAASRTGDTRLVYELLDIHGMMLGQGRAARILRRVEASLLRRTDLTVVSSPAFLRHYLDAYGQPATAMLLVENKPFALDPVEPVVSAPWVSGPLTIGWFGMLRCRWSLEVLDQLTRAHPGRFRVIMRGRPALDVMGDFHDAIAANPDLSFEGPYRWPDDLPEIYGQVHLAWLIDRYQAGENSDWLLPNRLYEGCLNGAVPIVLAGTEVARKAARWCGQLTVSAPDAAAVNTALTRLNPASVDAQRAIVADIPRAALEMNDAKCRYLAAAICGTDHPAPKAQTSSWSAVKVS